MSSVPLGPMYGTASSKYEDAKELACHSCFEVSPPAPAPAPQPQLMKQNISQSQVRKKNTLRNFFFFCDLRLALTGSSRCPPKRREKFYCYP